MQLRWQGRVADSPSAAVAMQYDASPEGIKKFETAMATPDVESQGKVLRWNILKC